MTKGETEMSKGKALVLMERLRQVEQKGYTAEHDARQWAREIRCAADAYRAAPDAQAAQPAGWPWPANAWKPRDRRGNLVRAGALYLAAADRYEQRKPGCGVSEELRGLANQVAADIDAMEA